MRSSRPISRVLSPRRSVGAAIIYLERQLPVASSGPPGTRTVRVAPCPPTRILPLFGLAPDGGCLAARVTTGAGGLLHHLFTITKMTEVALAVYFSVALFRRVTPPGRCPASYPVEPGLSSPRMRDATA